MLPSLQLDCRGHFPLLRSKNGLEHWNIRKSGLSKEDKDMWRDHKCEIYATPSGKLNTLTKWDDAPEDASAYHIVGRYLQAMTIHCFMQAYMQNAFDNESIGDIMRSIKSSMKSLNATPTDDVIQTNFYSKFVDKLLRNSNSNGKVHSFWKNMMNVRISKLPNSTQEAIQTLGKEWKTDVIASISFVLMVLKGKFVLTNIPFVNAPKLTDWISQSVTEDKQTRLHFSDSGGDDKNIEVNIKVLTEFLMKYLYDKTKEKLEDRLEKCPHLTEDAGKELQAGAEELREGFRSKAKIMARLIYFHFLDVKTYALNCYNDAKSQAESQAESQAKSR